MSDTKERVSLREFGRYIGVSDTFVKKQMFDAKKNAKGALRISQCVNENNGRPMLYKELALSEWMKAGLTIKNKELLEKLKASTPTQAVLTAEQPIIPAQPPPSLQADPPQNQRKSLADTDNFVSTGMDIYEAKAAKEIFVAGKHELSYRKMLGELVNKQEVYKQLFEFGQEIKSLLLQMPARVVAQIMAAETEREGKEILLQEIEKVLGKIAEGPKEEKQDEEATDEPAD